MKEAHSESMAKSSCVMEGKGFYNEHSHLQYQAVLKGIPLLERASERIALPESTCIIADYGASEGRNSLFPMARAIDSIRKRKNLAIGVVHTDLPYNDFNALFSQLLESPESYLKNRTDVYSYAAGKSFYESLFPEDTVSLGWSSVAVHWLSHVPREIHGHIWTSRAPGDVRKEFTAVAKEDWQKFLMLRAKELKSGGRLVLVGRVADDRGNTGAEGLLDMANEALKEMVSEGTLHDQEYDRMAIPTYYRTLEEYRAPFSLDTIGRALEIEECSLTALCDPLFDEYRQKGDAGSFADSYVKFFEAYSEASFLSSLDSSRSAAEKEELRQSFYQGVCRRISCDPARAVCPWNLILMTIVKR
jgi:hypothetical protein